MTLCSVAVLYRNVTGLPRGRVAVVEHTSPSLRDFRWAADQSLSRSPLSETANRRSRRREARGTRTAENRCRRARARHFLGLPLLYRLSGGCVLLRSRRRSMVLHAAVPDWRTNEDGVDRGGWGKGEGQSVDRTYQPPKRRASAENMQRARVYTAGRACEWPKGVGGCMVVCPGRSGWSDKATSWKADRADVQYHGPQHKRDRRHTHTHTHARTQDRTFELITIAMSAGA